MHIKNKLYTNEDVYILQAKYFQPNYQGNSRWIIIEPKKKFSFGAIGKDEFPEVIKILIKASSRTGIDYDSKLQPLIEKGFICNTKKENSNNIFLGRYHDYVSDYPFYNYSSESRWSKDKEQMCQYGKISLPPAVFSVFDNENLFNLPVPIFRRISSAKSPFSLLDILSTILAGSFQATGSISGGDFGPWVRKSSPSGGARHPTEAVVISHKTNILHDGCYFYDAPKNCLIKEKNINIPVQEFAEGVYVAFVSKVKRSMWRYRESRSLRAIVIDAGHVICTAKEIAISLDHSLSSVSIRLDQFDFDRPLLGFYKLDNKEPQVLNLKSKIINNKHFSLKEINNSIHLKTSPFCWLFISKGKLYANNTDNKTQKFELSDNAFLILNYCQPSKRGDRPSTFNDLLNNFGHDNKKLISNLIAMELLISADKFKNTAKKISNWIDHNWYQNLLVLNESFREICSHKEDFIKIKTNKKYEIKELYSILRKRKTTRLFSVKELNFSLVKNITQSFVDNNLLKENLISLYIAPTNCSGIKNNKVYKYDHESEHFISTGIHINSELIQKNTIGQPSSATAPLAMWIVFDGNTDNHHQYFNTMISLGEICQTICISAAEEGIGVFMTPAVNDKSTAHMLRLSSYKNPIYYFIALGLAETEACNVNENNCALKNPEFIEKSLKSGAKIYLSDNRDEGYFIISKNGFISQKKSLKDYFDNA